MAISKLKDKPENAKQWKMINNMVLFVSTISFWLIWFYGILIQFFTTTRKKKKKEKKRSNYPVQQRQYARFWANNTHQWLHLITLIRMSGFPLFFTVFAEHWTHNEYFPLTSKWLFICVSDSANKMRRWHRRDWYRNSINMPKNIVGKKNAL